MRSPSWRCRCRGCGSRRAVGAMPCVELGRYRRYRQDAVEKWLEECSRPGRRSRCGEGRHDERRTPQAAGLANALLRDPPPGWSGGRRLGHDTTHEKGRPPRSPLPRRPPSVTSAPVSRPAATRTVAARALDGGPDRATRRSGRPRKSCLLRRAGRVNATTGVSFSWPGWPLASLSPPRGPVGSRPGRCPRRGCPDGARQCGYSPKNSRSNSTEFRGDKRLSSRSSWISSHNHCWSAGASGADTAQFNRPRTFSRTPTPTAASSCPPGGGTVSPRRGGRRVRPSTASPVRYPRPAGRTRCRLVSVVLEE